MDDVIPQNEEGSDMPQISIKTIESPVIGVQVRQGVPLRDQADFPSIEKSEDKQNNEENKEAGFFARRKQKSQLSSPDKLHMGLNWTKLNSFSRDATRNGEEGAHLGLPKQDPDIMYKSILKGWDNERVEAESIPPLILKLRKEKSTEGKSRKGQLKALKTKNKKSFKGFSAALLQIENN